MPKILEGRVVLLDRAAEKSSNRTCIWRHHCCIVGKTSADSIRHCGGGGHVQAPSVPAHRNYRLVVGMGRLPSELLEVREAEESQAIVCLYEAFWLSCDGLNRRLLSLDKINCTVVTHTQQCTYGSASSTLHAFCCTCAGNICIYCPGGPDSDFEYSTQVLQDRYCT